MRKIPDTSGFVPVCLPLQTCAVLLKPPIRGSGLCLVALARKVLLNWCSRFIDGLKMSVNRMKIKILLAGWLGLAVTAHGWALEEAVLPQDTWPDVSARSLALILLTGSAAWLLATIIRQRYSIVKRTNRKSTRLNSS